MRAAKTEPSTIPNIIKTEAARIIAHVGMMSQSFLLANFCQLFKGGFSETAAAAVLI